MKSIAAAECIVLICRRMTDEIRILIDSLKRGQYENPAEKIGLLSAALRELPADVEMLLSLLRAPQVPLQLAAMDASRGRERTATFNRTCQHDRPRGCARPAQAGRIAECALF